MGKKKQNTNQHHKPNYRMQVFADIATVHQFPRLKELTDHLRKD